MIFFTLLSTALAQTADEIMQNIQAQQQWTQSILEIDLNIERDGKKEKQYQLKTHLRKEQDTLYTHTEFLAPTEVAGTKIIAIDFPEKPDLLHLFMPALGRVNTLNASGKKHAFMGSDLSFEDLEISNYDGAHSILSEDEKNWTIQTMGKNHPSYSKWVTVVEKSSYQLSSIDFFDKKDKLLKTMTIIEKTQALAPFPSKVEVIDRQNHSHTTFQIKNQSLEAVEIPLTLFEKEALIPKKEE